MSRLNKCKFRFEAFFIPTKIICFISRNSNLFSEIAVINSNRVYFKMVGITRTQKISIFSRTRGSARLIKCPQVKPVHSRPQRPRSFWSAPRIATSGRVVQQRKSAIHGLPVTLRMLCVKSDKSDWFWSQSIVFTNPFKTGMSLDLARGLDYWC